MRDYRGKEMSIEEQREYVYRVCSTKIEWFKTISYTLGCIPEGIDKKLRLLESNKGDSLLCYDVAIREFDYGFDCWFIDYSWILATRDSICIEYYLIDLIRLLKVIEEHISEHRDSIISKYGSFGYKDAEGVLKEKEERLKKEKNKCEKVVCLLRDSSLNRHRDTAGAAKEDCQKNKKEKSGWSVQSDIRVRLEQITDIMFNELHEGGKADIELLEKLMPTDAELQGYCMEIQKGNEGEYIIEHLFHDILPEWERHIDDDKISTLLNRRENLVLSFLGDKWYKDDIAINTNNEADCKENDMKTTGTLNQIKKHDALPVEFSSEEAKALLGKLIKGGFCDEKYDWKRSKILFAYFASKASDTLGLSNRMAGVRNAVSWKPFVELFTIKGEPISGLAQALNDFQKKGTAKGEEEINRLF